MQASISSSTPAGLAPSLVLQPRTASKRPFTTLHTRRQSYQGLVRSGDGSSEQQQQQPQQPQQPPPPLQQEEEPVWVRRERERALQAKEGPSAELPFGAYLLFSSFTAIAAIGSIFEYINQHALFDVVQPDSPLYVPILAFFALTGLPSSAFLFYKSVQAANRDAERMDKLDGY